MAPLIRSRIIPLIGVVCAACSGDATPTGSWIPLNGTFSGTVTVAAGTPAAVSAFPVAETGGSDLKLPALSTAEFSAVREVRQDQGRVRSPASRAEFSGNDLIVVFRPSLSGLPGPATTLAGTERADAAAAVMRSRLAALIPPGASIAGVSPVILAAKIHVRDAAERDAIAEAVRKDASVSVVVRNRLVSLDHANYALVPQQQDGSSTAAVPNNPFYVQQAWHYGLIDMPRAWEVSTGSNTVLVAVVDDGIRFDHPGIAGNLTTDGYDFVSLADTLPRCGGGTIVNSGDGDGYDPNPTIPASYDLTQQNCFALATLGAHGLHVAGTIGAVGNNGVGMTGINWNVRIRPVRVLGVGGVGDVYDVAQGVLYAAGLPADNGAGGTVQAATAARIINMSLGAGTDDPIMHDAVIAASNTGALIVAAAGNGGTGTPGYPAAYPEVLAVAAVKPDGTPAAYSNFGSYVAIRAPGGDFAANQGGGSGGVGSTLWSFSGTGSPAYGWAVGTSMAAPHVSGVAALMLARTPSLPATELRSRLTKWSTGGANQWGAGLLNAYNSLTQSSGPPRKLFVQLISAATGLAADVAPAADDGSFSFTHVRDGRYNVYGGADENGDGRIGVPGRWWGVLGGVADPSAILLMEPVVKPVSFAIGFPTIGTPDHTISTPYSVVDGGYVQAVLASTNQLDVYRFKASATGPYTFQTSGWVGACGYALEEATGIGVYDTSGHLLGNTTYVDGAHYNYCSRLTITLPTGSYLVGVAGAFANGRYRLEMKSGS